MAHDFSRFMMDLQSDLESDYELAAKWAREDPGTAGDQAEETWAELLRSWLPAGYPVVTKGRIVNELGYSSPQVDILVLQRDYPRALRSKKIFFAGGVVAAFECKLTLRRRDVFRFFSNAKRLRDLYERHRGTPYHELVRGPFYGLLAHSHAWKGSRDRVEDRITAAIEACLDASVHPADLPDALCVANVASFLCTRSIHIGYEFDDDAAVLFDGVDANGGVSSCFYRYADPGESRIFRGEVLAALIIRLWYRMAFEDPSLQWFADHLLQLPTIMTGLGLPYPWPSTVLSEDVVQELRESATEDYRWSHWSGSF